LREQEEAAARATLAGDAMGAPKSQDGSVEMMRLLRLQRRSAIRARTQAANQLHAVVSTAPEILRGTLRDLTRMGHVFRTAGVRSRRLGVRAGIGGSVMDTAPAVCYEFDVTTTGARRQWFRMTDLAKNPVPSVRDHLVVTYLTLDDRSLAAGRIGLALVLLFDLVRRVPGIATWYSNDGLLPNHMLLWQPTYDHALSLFYVASYRYEVAIGFGLCAVAYLMLLLGWRTRLAQILSLVAVLSLHARVLFLQNGGDVVLSEICLWTSFLPTGRRCSLDALRRARAGGADGAGASVGPSDHRVQSIACLAILLQLAAIYFFNWIQKSGQTWADGSAVHYALQADGQVTRLGVWLRPHLTLEVSRLLTESTKLVEAMAWVLILVPFATSAARLSVIVLLVGLHAGFSLCLNLGIFTPAMIACLPNLIPAAFWRRIEGTRFAGALAGAARALVARPWSPVAMAGGALRDFLGLPRQACALVAEGATTPARRAGLLAREGLVLALILVAATELGFENPAMPAPLRVTQQPAWLTVVVNGLQLFQGWRMFTPDPPPGDRTVVVDAVTADGRHVDPINEVARGVRAGRFSEATIPEGLGYDVFFGTYVDRIADFPLYQGALSEWILRYPERTGRAGDTVKTFTVSLVENDSPPPGSVVPTNPRATVFVKVPPDR
jgi:hypothetical protein